MADRGDISYNEDGIPICKGSVPMKYTGYNSKRNQHVYHCPAKYLGRTQGRIESKVNLDKCPLGVLCEPESKRGPYVYVKSDQNLRLFPKIARYSPLFKERFKRRNAGERYFSHIKSKIGRSPYRREYVLAFSLCMHGVLSHVLNRIKPLIRENTELWDVLESSLA